MSRQQIELLTLALVEIVTSGGRIEDVTAEAKTIWPDVKKAPRQLAAHANTARGESLLWIIGLDENKHEVLGAGDVELAEWWPAVLSAFDEGIAPDLVPVVVPVSVEKTVVALFFSTDRAPYVVKRQSPDGWSENDVPWRDGNRTRSAHRDELLRMLMPAILPPDADVIEGSLTAYPPFHMPEEPKPDRVNLSLQGKIFFGPPAVRVVALPAHGMKGQLYLYAGVDAEPTVIDMKVSLGNPGHFRTRGWMRDEAHPLGVDCRPGATYITGPGIVSLQGSASGPSADASTYQAARRVVARIMFAVAGSERPLILELQLEEAERVTEWEETKQEYLARWTTAGWSDT